MKIRTNEMYMGSEGIHQIIIHTENLRYFLIIANICVGWGFQDETVLNRTINS